MSSPSQSAAKRRGAFPRASRLGFLLLAIALVAGAPSQAADSWRLPGLDGGALSSADVADGATVIVVFAAWSPHCRDIVTRTNAVAERWGGRARVAMVDFQEEPADVRAFLADKGARARVYLDGDGTFAKGHRVTSLPGLVVYRNGEVAFQGKLPSDVDAVLAEALP